MRKYTCKCVMISSCLLRHSLPQKTQTASLGVNSTAPESATQLKHKNKSNQKMSKQNPLSTLLPVKTDAYLHSQPGEWLRTPSSKKML